MIKIICDVKACGKDITMLSNRVSDKNKAGVEVNKKHVCHSCLVKVLTNGKQG